MAWKWQFSGLLVVSAVFAVPSTTAGIWDDDIRIYTDPSSPTDQDIFDLGAVRDFPDPGYLGIDQSISVHGHEIDIWALIQDQHTRPNTVFAASIGWAGAFLNDVGPIAAGTYQVNVEIWLTPWPATSGGKLIDQEILPFTVIGADTAVPEPTTALLLLFAIAGGSIRRRTV